MSDITVFNKEKVDFTKQPMFFGEALNSQRFDVFKYPVFDKLTQTQLGFFWRPEEVSLQKDRSDYLEFRDEQKFIFTANLKYQILLDSVQGRGPAMAFMPYCSLPELEGCMNAWQFFENIHSRSYTHIIKNVYSNPTEVFDTMLDDEKIIARAKTVTRAYDDFIDAAQLYTVAGKGDIRDVKKKLFLAMVNVNALEALRFYVSFACSFAFGELKKMEGSAKIISLIARDESQHLSITNHIIKNWFKGDDPEMQEIVEANRGAIGEIYDMVVQEEKDWADYLFSRGAIVGLNEKLLHQYIEYQGNRRLKGLGIEPRYERSANDNPLPWTEHWLSSRGLQVAPQQTQIQSYVIGGIKQDVSKDTFAGFKL
jgi:ribonucleoside-diphosphate reductase beta chain